MLELLVVVAIVTVLAALLLPALGKARSAADAAGCRSNLHQLTLGVSMYAQENHVFPGLDTSPGTTAQPLDVELLRYTSAPRPTANYDSYGSRWAYLGPRSSIWACPTYNRIQGLFGGPPLDLWATASYGYNFSGSTDVEWRGLGGSSASRAWNPTKEEQVLNPSDMICFGDSVLPPWPLAGVGGPVYGVVWLNVPMDRPDCYNAAVRGLPASSPAAQAMKQRHGWKWNVGFCDDHVETIKPSDLFNVGNPAVAQRWNSDHKPHLEDGWAAPPPP